MIANIFVRESQKYPGKNFYTMSIVGEDGVFEDAGFVKPIRDAKSIIDAADAAGLMVEGLSNAGAYKMLTVNVDDECLVSVGGKTYLKNILSLC